MFSKNNMNIASIQAMIDERKRLICDCCGRQIVDYKANDEFIIGPKKGTELIGINQHTCHECYSDWRVQQQIDKELGLQYEPGPFE